MFNFYNRYLRFALEFVEIAWITSMHVQYATSEYANAYIWIIPVVLSKLLSARLSPRLAFFMILFGQVITALSGLISTQIISLPLSSLILGTIGWTLADVGFDVVDQVEGFHIVSFLSRVLAYGASFFLATLYVSKNYIKLNFTEVSYVMYFASALIFLPIALFNLVRKPDPVDEVPAEPLPEFSFKERIRAFLTSFFGNFIVDTILIYGTLWAVYDYVENDDFSLKALKKGLCYGCLAFVGYSLVRLFVRVQGWDLVDVKRRMLVTLGVLIYLFYCNVTELHLGQSIMLILVGGYFQELFLIYQELVAPDVKAPNARFFQLIAVLSIFPSIFVIGMKEDDSILIQAAAGGMGVCLALLVVSQGGPAQVPKEKKE